MAYMDVAIQALSGSHDSQTEMDGWALAGLHDILNALPDEILKDYATETELTNVAPQLANVNLKRVLSVFRRESDIGAYIACRGVDLHEFNKGGDSNSIYQSTVFSPMYNIDKNILSVSPEPTASQKAYVKHFAYPQTVNVSAVEEYAGIENLPPNITRLVILFAAAKVLHNKMVDKASSLPSDLVVPVLDIMSISLPTYTAPTAFVMPVSPSGVNIDFSEVGTLETFVHPVMNEPDWADANTWISTEEDSEMLAARVQEISGKVQEYNTSVGAESSRVTSSLNDYQQKVNKAIQTYQSETGYDLSKYQADVQTEVQRYQNDLQQNTSSFNNDLQRYTSEMQKVSTDNQSKLSKFGQDLGNYSAIIQKHGTDYQWLQNQYTQVKQDYMQGLQQLMGGGQAPQGG